jgi:hypothetical protein
MFAGKTFIIVGTTTFLDQQGAENRGDTGHRAAFGPVRDRVCTRHIILLLTFFLALLNSSN